MRSSDLRQKTTIPTIEDTEKEETDQDFERCIGIEREPQRLELPHILSGQLRPKITLSWYTDCMKVGKVRWDTDDEESEPNYGEPCDAGHDKPGPMQAHI